MKINKRGFTIVELLSVIAIIAVLAAILFPVFGRARSAALRATSMSNVRQLGSFFHLYLSANDDISVPYFSGFNAATRTYHDPQRYWPDLILPETRSGSGVHGQRLFQEMPQIMKDPSSRAYIQPVGSVAIVGSYGINDTLTNWFSRPEVVLGGIVPGSRIEASKFPVGAFSVESTSEMFAFVSTRSWMNEVENAPGYILALPPLIHSEGSDGRLCVRTGYAGDGFDSFLPTSVGLACFVDGHARALSRQKLQVMKSWFPNGSTWPN